MSNSSTQSRRTGSGGGRQRSGSRRRRNNKNNNYRGENAGQRRRGGRRNRREPKPAPLAWWQKLLKSVGLYDPDKKFKPPKREASAKRAKPKSGTRVAKGPEARAVDPKEVDSNRLYLGNLSYDASEYEIEDLFKGVGTVRKVEIVYNRNTHKSKGYGFLEMSSIEEARRAVEVLHDQPFMGRKMIVTAAKSRGPSSQDDDNSEEAA